MSKVITITINGMKWHKIGQNEPVRIRYMPPESTYTCEEYNGNAEPDSDEWQCEEGCKGTPAEHFTDTMPIDVTDLFKDYESTIIAAKVIYSKKYQQHVLVIKQKDDKGVTSLDAHTLEECLKYITGM